MVSHVPQRRAAALSENGCERILSARSSADKNMTGDTHEVSDSYPVGHSIPWRLCDRDKRRGEQGGANHGHNPAASSAFSTDADKQSLKQITEDKSATKDERTVAQALMDVQHTAAAADKPKLEAIVKDDSAASSVKTLASIILNLKHMPSESDKEKLKALAT